MDNSEYEALQQEELEVLHSIYEGDDCFKEINPTTFQYKYGEDGSYKSFIIEFVWGETYPEHPPKINLNLFYNKHLLESVKACIIQEVHQQASDWLGAAMSFTLFEWVKENLDTLLKDQPDSPPQLQLEELAPASDENRPDSGKKKEKKEQLTKNQKKKLYSSINAKGERPRGWDWVDVVKHLSQTGGCKDNTE